MTDQKEKWPGQNNGLPEPGTKEWEEHHKQHWERNKPNKVSDASPSKPLADLDPID